MPNIENDHLYDRMKELMINFAKLDWKSIKQLIGTKLEEQVLTKNIFL